MIFPALSHNTEDVEVVLHNVKWSLLQSVKPVGLGFESRQ